MRHRPLHLRALLALSLLPGLAACGGSDSDLDGSADGRSSTSLVLTIPEEATTTEGSAGTEDDGSASTDGTDADGTAADGTDNDGTATDDTDTDGSSDSRAWLDETYQLLELASVDYPTALTERSGGDDLWLTEREGRVRQIQRRTNLDGDEQAFKLMNTVVLDITDLVSTEGEGGLLGLAFSSDGRHLYVSYTNTRGDSVVAEYEMDAIAAIPDSERILLEVDQPFSNHNGGQITLGPDGFLYVALGDGGSGGDPQNNGQDTSTLLGSILRIDPAGSVGERPYGVPAGNPFADGEDGRPEIWLWGVRNPWRFSFDRSTGDLWIGDVGQNAIEEIDRLPNGVQPAGRGANLGWRVMEGDTLFDGDEPPAGHVPPIYTYRHEQGRCSVTGGYVYRGGLIPDLDGVYLFADYCSGEILGLEPLGGDRIVVANLATDRAAGPIVSFGQDGDGELYVLEAGGPVSLLRRPGAPPRTEVLGPDDSFPGGAVDDTLEPADGADEG